LTAAIRAMNGPSEEIFKGTHTFRGWPGLPKASGKTRDFQCG
jgi:hypothetical protein